MPGSIPQIRSVVTWSLLAKRSVETEHMAHVVCARTLSCGPDDGLQGTRGKCLAALRTMRKFDALYIARKHDSVIAHD